MIKRKDINIQEIAFHRNSISGSPFYVIRFRWKPVDMDVEENFLATLFEQMGTCAVIGLDRLNTQGVKFAAGNSWRGDHFEPALRFAIEQWNSTPEDQ